MKRMNKVSKLCFGALTISPLQQNFTPEEAADLMEYAFNKGINFFDTAEIYESYHLFRAFLKRTIAREDVFISTKCYAYDYKTAEASLNQALEEMQTPYIDLMMLHEQESEHSLRGHNEALQFFDLMKKEGKIRHIGMSTHFVEGVLAGSNHQLIEVIHPIINKRGLGIIGGNREDMENALKVAKEKGKFIFAMKVLGGGHLLKDYSEALCYAQDLPWIDSIAIGMQSKEEVDANVSAILKRERISSGVYKKRKLIIDPYCIGCGKCVDRCQQKALYLDKGKAKVLNERCILCSYCVGACEDFYIKVV